MTFDICHFVFVIARGNVCRPGWQVIAYRYFLQIRASPAVWRRNVGASHESIVVWIFNPSGSVCALFRLLVLLETVSNRGCPFLVAPRGRQGKKSVFC